MVLLVWSQTQIDVTIDEWRDMGRSIFCREGMGAVLRPEEYLGARLIRLTPERTLIVEQKNQEVADLHERQTASV